MKRVALIIALVGTVLISGETTVKCRNRCQNRLIAQTVEFVVFHGFLWTAEKWGPSANSYGVIAGPANQMETDEFAVYCSQVHEACVRLDDECQGGGVVANDDWGWNWDWWDPENDIISQEYNL